ncbi:MAG TPA: NAD-dependent epimerase/dehydratase family protein [archaeon]|nr:NAD-dependent epimerase/dehydratase family protein [archaeon]
MKLFITGATGFFGSNLTDYLLRNTGHSLVLLVRDRRRRNLPAESERVRIVKGDLHNLAMIKEGLAGCDAVIHAAAHVSTWARDPKIFDRVNVQGALNMLSEAGAAGIQKIIYISSFLALGYSKGDPLTEADSFKRNTFFNDYERTKYLANLKVMELAAKGLPLTILYPTVMYGPGPRTAGNLVVNLLLDYMRGKLQFRLGDGTQRWNYVFVEDVVRGALLALELGKSGDRYILGGENVSALKFFDTVEKVTGVRQPRLAIPFPMARLFGAAEEAAAFLTGRIPQTTRGVVDIFQKDWIYDSALAKKNLGFESLSLEEGLVRTVEWIRRDLSIHSSRAKRKGAVRRQ